MQIYFFNEINPTSTPEPYAFKQETIFENILF